MDIKKAKENREEFLTPYKEKFRKSKKEIERYKEKLRKSESEKERYKGKLRKSEKECSKIISELIAIEPSHLNEPWIIKEVVKWMRDRNSFDFLEDAFIKSPKKYALTEKQEFKQARDFFVRHKIDQIIAKKGVSEREAVSTFVRQLEDIMSKFEGDKYLGWDVAEEYDNYNYLEKAIRKVYQNAKKQPERLLPWPYYGKDVEIDENGKVIIFGGR